MVFEHVVTLAESLISIVLFSGYFGIFLLVMVESFFPPVPSDAWLVAAGILIYRGQLDPFLSLICAVAGAIVGSLVNYHIGRILGRRLVEAFVDRWGIWLGISHSSISKAENFFLTHGAFATFFGRFIPVIRYLVSLPAGFARMRLLTFCVMTGLGAALWSACVLLVGYLTGRSESFLIRYADPLTALILSFCCFILAWYIWRRVKNRTVS